MVFTSLLSARRFLCCLSVATLICSPDKEEDIPGKPQRQPVGRDNSLFYRDQAYIYELLEKAIQELSAADLYSSSLALTSRDH